MAYDMRCVRAGWKNAYKIKNVSHNWQRQRAHARADTRACAARTRNRTYVGRARGTSKAAVEIVRDKSGFRARWREKACEGGKKRVENWHARHRADRCTRPAAACKRAKMHCGCLESNRKIGRAAPDRSVVGRFCHSFVHTVGPLTLIAICAIFFHTFPIFHLPRMRYICREYVACSLFDSPDGNIDENTLCHVDFVNITRIKVINI